MTIAMQHGPRTNALRIIGGLALAWNAFGVVQFIGSVGATKDGLIAAGLTAEQAAVMTGYPVWMTAAFAFGVFGGLAGSVLLLMRKASALPVFLVSLAGYIALYVGDIVHGVFAVMGMPQIAILSLVVAIAGALVWISRRIVKNGTLV